MRVLSVLQWGVSSYLAVATAAAAAVAAAAAAAVVDTLQKCTQNVLHMFIDMT